VFGPCHEPWGQRLALQRWSVVLNCQLPDVGVNGDGLVLVQRKETHAGGDFRANPEDRALKISLATSSRRPRLSIESYDVASGICQATGEARIEDK